VAAPTLQALRRNKFEVVTTVVTSLTPEQQRVLRQCLKDLRSCCAHAGMGDTLAVQDVKGVQKVLLRLLLPSAQAAA
jgi:hypothetical protein